MCTMCRQGPYEDQYQAETEEPDMEMEKSEETGESTANHNGQMPDKTHGEPCNGRAQQTTE